MVYGIHGYSGDGGSLAWFSPSALGETSYPHAKEPLTFWQQYLLIIIVIVIVIAALVIAAAYSSRRKK